MVSVLKNMGTPTEGEGSVQLTSTSICEIIEIRSATFDITNVIFFFTKNLYCGFPFRVFPDKTFSFVTDY